MTDLVILQRLLLITLIAGAIGFERERRGRAAGFRTHILVGVGACLIMLTGLYLAESLAGRTELDPTRMAAQVISGIGFLGAGTILRFRASVRGLTTAASLWTVGGVGVAVGAGFVHGALLTGLTLILVLFGLSRLEQAMRKDWYQTLIVETVGTPEELVRVRALLAEYDLEIHDLDVKPGHQADRVRLEFQVKSAVDQPREEIIEHLRRSTRAVEAHWV
ncbi:MAG: MgtC/SapB family protein [Candidatus Omnitrophica bacterium]|nr:MgtC/SapB family protein [Candidatus Omnitrophota bacterium]